MPHTSILAPATLAATPWLVLDARGEDDYRNGHWQDAVHVPITAWEAAAKQADTGLNNDAHWRALIGSLGIDGGRKVAIYDDGRMTEAARVWFILQYFGVTAAVVDGGWPLLSAQEDCRIETSAVTPETVDCHAAVRPKGSVGLVSRLALRDALGTDARILDARTAAEFTGEDLRRNARGGHLPNARRVGHAELLRADGRLKPAHELRSILVDAGFKPGDRIVTHCDGGGRAALAALAAVEAGFANVDAYYLSFSDWAKDGSCPIVSPSTSNRDKV